MAGIGFSINYDAKPFKAIGRDVAMVNVSKGAVMSQDDLDAAVQAMFGRCSITVIGDFTAGTSTSVNMVIEGMDFYGADAYGTGVDYLDELTALTGMTVTAIAF